LERDELQTQMAVINVSGVHQSSSRRRRWYCQRRIVRACADWGRMLISAPTSRNLEFVVATSSWYRNFWLC